ncbi:MULTISPECIES: VOC family protein [unclassified Leisingera]|uniref:VOC family protein n=1 Tax=unclassified Leisingera TaxID=2614906 RepID=UPI0002F2C48E|nr:MULTISPECIES: VOC family protein [unclassified Leisingera]KIC22970.1 methylmalonyl-CoA epimerase [Leisingera sp. ANG-S3]KIC52450.1 methylmalonyl-CoA epimerase [Leisingera sp. ANG-S]KID07467.1 methylmalonyl-CoA epimerase [Leisingera sp. ANG1]
MDLSKLPSVVDGETLSNSFLGNAVELCIVTDDHMKTMEGLCQLGIGPWAVYTFSPETVSDQTYKGEPCAFALKVCFAQSGNMIWELMQPLWGPSIFQDFLDKHGTGFHHVAYDCNNEPWEIRISELEKRGFKVVQSGKWQGQNAFAFFDTEAATGATFETYHFPEGWDYPEPESWFPAPPPAGADW